jgi:cytochrome b561
MKRKYKTALPSETLKIQLKAAKVVHTLMYFVFTGIAISGLGIGTLFSLGYKDGLLIETIIWLHELLFSISLWLISIHILAAIYHRTQHDFVWSSMVPFLKEKVK